MELFVSIINLILYSCWDWLNQFLKAFGLSWAGLTVGLAVVSVILRLFAANLVGTAVNIHHSHQDAGRQQRIEKQKASAARGRGASTSSRLKRNDYSFSARNSAVRDHFISKTRKG